MAGYRRTGHMIISKGLLRVYPIGSVTQSVKHSDAYPEVSAFEDLLLP